LPLLSICRSTMNHRFILLSFLLITISCCQLIESLKCFEHDRCNGADCPSLSSALVKTCPAGQDFCWTHQFNDGIGRGCSTSGCPIRIEAGVTGTANHCCSTDLCNSAFSVQTNRIIMITGLFALFLLYGQRN